MPRILMLGAIDYGEPHLDENIADYPGDMTTLVASGGNCHRWTLVDFTNGAWSNPPPRRQPFRWDGSKFVMNNGDSDKDTTWWANFQTILDEAALRNIKIQIELFDCWNLRDGPEDYLRWYKDSCWGPLRNNHYNTGIDTGMPDDFITSSIVVMATNAFYTAVSGGLDIDGNRILTVDGAAAVLDAQKQFVRWVVQACDGYDVIFQIENESPAPLAFSEYFCDYIHSIKPDACVTDMQETPDFTSTAARHAATQSRFDFADISQVNKYLLVESQDGTLDDNFNDIVMMRGSTIPTKPINATKIYNRINYGDVTPNTDDGVALARMGVFIMAGAAWASMHPTNAGTGMSGLALAMISGLRWLDNNVELEELSPVPLTSSLWGGTRPPTGNDVNDVSAWAMSGTDAIVIFMNGAVSGLRFNTTSLGATIRLRWRSCNDSATSSPASQASATNTPITNPFGSDMAVVIIEGV